MLSWHYSLFSIHIHTKRFILTLTRLPRHASHKRNYVDSSGEEEYSAKNDDTMDIEHDGCG